MRVVFFSLFFFVLTTACNRKSRRAVSVTTIEPTKSIVKDTAHLEVEKETTVVKTPVQRIELEKMEEKPSKPIKIQPYLLASLKKTPCYGNCPAFEAQLFSDGRMVYRGNENTSRIGLFEARTTASEIQALLNQARELRYFEHQSRYPTKGKLIQDLPMTVTFVKDRIKENEVRNNYFSPESLKEFEAFLLTFFEKANWRRIAN